MSHILASFLGGPYDWIVLAIIGLLLFGKRLPEVGRSVGKGIVEFKKGLKGVEDDVEKAAESTPATPQAALPNTQVAALPAAYKFDPYTGKPLNQSGETSAPAATQPPANPQS